MQRKFLAAMAACATMALTPVALPTIAQARDACGVGKHRASNGRCYWNRTGVYYHGLGYWDGHRYYMHRSKHKGHWRYW